jgi:hypothetical protein
MHLLELRSQRLKEIASHFCTAQMIHCEKATLYPDQLCTTAEKACSSPGCFLSGEIQVVPVCVVYPRREGLYRDLLTIEVGFGQGLDGDKYLNSYEDEHSSAYSWFLRKF